MWITRWLGTVTVAWCAWVLPGSAAASAPGVEPETPPTQAEDLRPAPAGADAVPSDVLEAPGGRFEHPSGADAPRGLWVRLSEVERRRVAAFLEEHFPRLFEEMKRSSDRGGERFERRVYRILPEILELMEVMETDPQRGALMIQERRLDMRLHHLARRYRAVDDERQRARLRDETRRLGAEMFDLRHQRRALEIMRLEVRILELKGRHEEATRMRGTLVERFVRERLDERPPRPDDRPRGPD